MMEWLRFWTLMGLCFFRMASSSSSSSSSSSNSNIMDVYRPVQRQPISWPVCGCQDCAEGWVADASGYTCGDRITFLMQVKEVSPSKACRTVAASEFPSACKLCNPDTCTRITNAGDEPENQPTEPPRGNDNYRCGCDLCEKFAWQVDAAGYTCGARIDFLLSLKNSNYATEEAACRQVASNEFPSECGLCAPGQCDGTAPPPVTAPPTQVTNQATNHLPPKELYCYPPESQRTRFENVWGKFSLEVKEGDTCGPSDNLFTKTGVSVGNNNNELTLSLGRQSDGRWYAGEVRVLLPDTEYYDYGRYSFSIKSVAVFDSVTGKLISETLPPSIILGLFTWDDTKNYAIRENYSQEVDIELSRWNIRDNQDVQFLVQPPGNPQMFRFYSGEAPTMSLPVYDQAPHEYSFLWNPAEIIWSSTSGGGQSFTYGAKEALAVGQPDYTQCMPANVEVRINLWNLFGSFQAPTDMEDSHVVHVVIDKFEYQPTGVQALPESGVCTKDCQCDENSQCISNRCTSTGSEKTNIAAATTDSIEDDSSVWRHNRWLVLGLSVSLAVLLVFIVLCYFRRQQSNYRRQQKIYATVRMARDYDDDLESSSSSENDPYRMATEGVEVCEYPNPESPSASSA